MSDFVLTCESAADRTREFFESRNIPVVCFHYEIDDVVYTDDLYQSITPDEFFAQIAAGAMPKTSQVSVPGCSPSPLNASPHPPVPAPS